MDNYLLIGQSNMCGRGFLNTVEPLKDKRVRMFRVGRWQEAREPLFADKETAGVGPGMSFALRLLREAPERTIGLLPCAFGGTKLEMWMPGEDLYEHAVAIARIASRQGTLKGILWHQGEGDSGDSGRAALYGERFERMIAQLRDDLRAESVPVVAGELGEFLKDREGIPHYPLINRALHDLEGILPHFAVVSSAGLTDIGDRLHFDAPSQRIFGERYAEAFLRVAGLKA